MKNIFEFGYNHSILSVSNSLLKYYNVPIQSVHSYHKKSPPQGQVFLMVR